MCISKRFIVIVTALIVVAFASSGCRRSQVDPYPVSGAIAGWQKTSTTRVFAAKNLWQYIDGDADRYIKAGVISASTSDYRYRDRLDAVADIYQMGDSASAREILDGERSKAAFNIHLGDDGIAYEQSVAFCKGSRFVRIVAYQNAADTQHALLALAQGVEERLSIK